MIALRSRLKSTRLWGLVSTAVALYLLVFVVFGKVDVSWIMPDTTQIAKSIIKVWPQMPFFVQHEQTAQGEVVTYTVSSHIYSAEELRKMGVTNAVLHPAPPKAPK